MLGKTCSSLTAATVFLLIGGVNMKLAACIVYHLMFKMFRYRPGNPCYESTGCTSIRYISKARERFEIGVTSYQYKAHIFTEEIETGFITNVDLRTWVKWNEFTVPRYRLPRSTSKRTYKRPSLHLDRRIIHQEPIQRASDDPFSNLSLFLTL